MRILLLLVTCLFYLSTSAQVRIGGQLGYSRVTWVSVNHVNDPNNDFSFKTSGQEGFQNGIVAEIKLFGKWYLRPILFVTGKGTWISSTTSFDTSSVGIWIRYIELPIAVINQFHISNKLSAIIGGGGYAAYGIRGIEKGKGKSYDGPHLFLSPLQFETHVYGNGFQVPPGIIYPFDYGLTFLAGIEDKNVQLLINYSRGLKKLLPNGEFYNVNYVNNSVTFSVAYLIDTKLIKKWFR